MIRPEFVPFDEHHAVRIYRRNLPHWRQAGATYFVTFRLGDSIPTRVVRQWEYEKQQWLTARGVPGKPRPLDELSETEQAQYRKHFNRIFHAGLDKGLGHCHLKRPACLGLVRDRLLAHDGMSYHLGDFVIMPNHVHLLLVPAHGYELETILKAIKGSTARKCNQLLRRTGTFWQADSYDHIVRDLEQLVQFRGYIADNPNKAGIVVSPTALYRAEWMDQWFSS
jgi:type I restriction enzyme R subunit